MTALAGLSASLLPLLSLVANAAVCDPIVHLAFEDTAGVDEREFFQTFVPDEKGPPFLGRRVDSQAVLTLLNALGPHPDRERIQRAMGQYQYSLLHWVHGEETLALAHLFMGMEALTKVFLRRECNERRLAEDGLAAHYGIEKKHLDPYIRKTLLFKGDEACLARAKQASDGFEHGFLDFNEVRSLATDVRDKTATFLRDAIMDISGCDPTALRGIREGRYRVPLGAWKMVKYLRGTLIGKGPDLAAEGNAYPIMEWRSSIKVFRKVEDGKYEYTPDETMTPKLGQGIAFKPKAFEVWGPDDGTGDRPRRGVAEIIKRSQE